MKRIYIVGTADTKAAELAYLRDLVSGEYPAVALVDVGTRKPAIAADVSAETVAACHPNGVAAVLDGDDRGKAVAAMGIAFAAYLSTRKDIAAVIGIGGGGGTAIVTAGMRTLPFGIPKLMVSTLASGDVSPYVDISDITMMPAVTDLAGLNALSRAVLRSAAGAITGMTRIGAPPEATKPPIGLTMFGVTTPAVTAIGDQLRDRFDCMVFHATGTGGRVMEKLADSGVLTGFLDITTTEICDLLLGGVLAADADRLGAVARSGLPYVGSVGALDMVNFWSPETVPAQYRDRLLYRHNPNVTLMRTNTEECRQIGEWLADKLNRCPGEIRLLLPEKGISALDIEGGAFHDPEADAALFEAIAARLEETDKRRLVHLPVHINDAAFADAAVSAFNEIYVGYESEA